MKSVDREVPMYSGHIHIGRYCALQNIDYSVTTFATDGASFTKYHKLPKGIEVEAYVTGKRFMLRFDIPLIAINEYEAPFSSKLYRIFVNEEELKMWKLIKK